MLQRSANISRRLVTWKTGLLLVTFLLVGCGGGSPTLSAPTHSTSVPAATLPPTSPPASTTATPIIAPTVESPISGLTIPVSTLEEAVATLMPGFQEISAGERFTLDLVVEPHEHGLSGSQITFSYNPNLLTALNIEAGILLGEDPLIGQTTVDNERGEIVFVIARSGPTEPPTSDGILVTSEWRVNEQVSAQESVIALVSVVLSDENFQYISPVKIGSATVQVTP